MSSLERTDRRARHQLADDDEQAIHERWMGEALELAREAAEAGEVPVGCVLVADGEVIGRGRNSPIAMLDPTAHAEMLALRQGALAVGNYRLESATLYCTLEPCPMCAGALVAARVGRLVFGARDLRFGGVRSKFEIADSPLLNHRVDVVEGIGGAEATELLRAFFLDRRESASAIVPVLSVPERPPGTAA
jgi:tRNA(adenine34) deaminase